MTIDMVTVDMRLDIRDVKIGVFDPFPAFQNHWRADQFDPGDVAKISFNPGGQIRLCGVQGLVEHYQNLGGQPLTFGPERLTQQRIVPAKDVSREKDAVGKSNMDGTLNTGHSASKVFF